MATYTTVERLKDTTPALGSATNISSAVIADFIERAESIVNGKLIRYYNVPVAGVPLIETVSTDIASYLLLSRRVYVNEKKDETVLPTRYREALKILDEIYYGRMELVSSSGTLVTKRDGNAILASSTQDYEPTFSEGDMRESRIDPYKDV